MRDKSQLDLESIFERRYILREDDVGSMVANRLANKPVEQVIAVIVSMIDIGTDVGQALIDRIAAEKKLGN